MYGLYQILGFLYTFLSYSQVMSHSILKFPENSLVFFFFFPDHSNFSLTLVQPNIWPGLNL